VLYPARPHRLTIARGLDRPGRHGSSIRDPATGAVRPAQLFIAALGASNYTYAEATWTQTLPDRL
jgi:transposase